MAIKELQTRIALKYDSYSAWTTTPGKDLVLLKGELGICHIGEANQGSNVVPTVLFKVGDGTSTFEKLPWASAKAADVYNWAKASEVKRDGKKLTFVGGVVNADGTRSNLEVPFDYVTLTEVKEITDPLVARIEVVEAKFSGTNSIEGQISGLDQRLDVLEGADTVEGSVANAVKITKAYTDEVAGAYAEGETAATGLRKEIADAQAAAQAAAKSYTDAEIDKIEAKDEAQDTALRNNSTAISNEATTRENADKAITDTIGEGFDNGENTVAKKVAAAAALGQQGIDDAAAAQTAVDNLTRAGGAVAVNAAAIEQIQSAIGDDDTGLAALDSRLDRVEAFFGTADKDGTDTTPDKTVYDALDTLKEIQDYIISDGSAAADMLDAIDANAEAITALQTTLATGGDFEKKVAANAAAIEANTSDIETLQKLTSGYTGEKAIYNRVEAISERAEKGITDAKNAQDAVDALERYVKGDDNNEGLVDRVDALEDIVGDTSKGLVKKTNENEAAIEALTGDKGRVTVAEGEIDAIQAIVYKTVDGTTTTIREDVTALQILTGDASKGNVALYNEIARVAALVDDPSTGLDKAYTAATNAQSRLEAIERDYLKAADEFIFQCGTATTVVHNNTAN